MPYSITQTVELAKLRPMCGLNFSASLASVSACPPSGILVRMDTTNRPSVRMMWHRPDDRLDAAEQGVSVPSCRNDDDRFQLPTGQCAQAHGYADSRADARCGEGERLRTCAPMSRFFGARRRKGRHSSGKTAQTI